MGLILRTQATDTNASGISVKGSSLTYAEGDSNFIYLLTHMSGSTLSLNGTTGITGNTTITGNLTVTGILTSATGFTGNLIGTAQTASYVALTQGPGIVINASNPLAISSSIVTVNGIYPINGNVATSLTQTITGTSASLILSSSGNITASFPDGLVWIVTSGPNTGSTFIYASASVGQWFPVGNFNQAANNSLYLQLIGGTMNGAINMGGNNITNGNLIGTASWASNALNANTASYATQSLSSSYALTASYVSSIGSVNGINTKVAVFSGASTITGSSIMTDNGIVINITGSLISGNSNTANGVYSHAEGYSTTAAGTGSHAEGVSTTANNDYSHAEGQFTIASGVYSHAEGSGSIAFGTGSHAGGIGTIASGSGQNVVGQFNKQNNPTSLFVIGNGLDNLNRSDIVNVTTSSVQITGSLNISGSTYQTGSVSLTGSLNVTGSTTQIGVLVLSGSAFLTGSTTQIGRLIISGSTFTTGSQTTIGTNIISGSLNTTGSVQITGSLNVSGSVTFSNLTISSSVSNVVTINPTTGQLYYTASSAIGGGTTGSLATTGSTIYSLNPASAVPAGSDTVGGIVIGNQAGYAGNISQNVIIGDHAGYNGGGGVLIGLYAGSAGAGGVAIGEQAGQNASQASTTVMIGYLAGYNTVSGSRSVIIGYKAGNTATVANTPGANNIIIGSNISLPAGRKDSINLGGIIFATGSYATTSGNAFTGSMQAAKVGIATNNPTETLDVSGSARVTDVLVLPFQSPLPSGKPTGSVAISGSGGTFNGMYVYNGTVWTNVKA
jgi:hypothetical protein